MTDSLRDQLLGLGFKPAPKPDKPDRPPRPRTSVREDDPRARHGTPAPHRPKPDGDRRPHDPARPRHAPSPQDARPRPGAPDQRVRRHDGKGSDRPGAPGSGAGPRRPPSATPRPREDIDLAKAYAIRAQREKDERIAAEKARQEEARLRREAKLKLAELLKDQGLNDPAADIARHFDYGGKIKRIHVTADQLKALNSGELGVVQLDGRYLLVSAALLAQAQEIFAPAVALRVDPAAPAGDDPYADPQYQVPDDLVW